MTHVLLCVVAMIGSGASDPPKLAVSRLEFIPDRTYTPAVGDLASVFRHDWRTDSITPAKGFTTLEALEANSRVKWADDAAGLKILNQFVAKGQIVFLIGMANVLEIHRVTDAKDSKPDWALIHMTRGEFAGRSFRVVLSSLHRLKKNPDYVDREPPEGKNAVPGKPASMRAFNIAFALEKAGKLDAAAREYRGVVARFPGTTAAQVAAVRLHLMAQQKTAPETIGRGQHQPTNTER